MMPAARIDRRSLRRLLCDPHDTRARVPATASLRAGAAISSAMPHGFAVTIGRRELSLSPVAQSIGRRSNES
jgi:hypothetical protein